MSCDRKNIFIYVNINGRDEDLHLNPQKIKVDGFHSLAACKPTVSGYWKEPVHVKENNRFFSDQD